MPVFGVTLIMVGLHFAQLLVAYELVWTFLLNNSKKIELSRTAIYIITGVGVLVFMTFFNEKRLQNYKSIFLDKPIENMKGRIFVFHFFIIGTIITALITPIILLWFR